MENAGRAVADVITARHPLGTKVAVVAGRGSNGGDGLVAARVLSDRGYPVRVFALTDGKHLQGDAAEAARRLSLPLEAASPQELSGAGVVVDALFGAGLNRPVDGVSRAMIEAVNTCGAPVVAVDLPSGINGSTGAVMAIAVKADETVTFFRRKPGHLLLPGRLHCGKLHVAAIGISDDVLGWIAPRTFANDPALWVRSFPFPRVEDHKYSRGHAVVVSGGVSRTGAARLAARAALRAGAGLVTLASPREALGVNAAASLAVMVRPVDAATELSALLSDRRFNVVAVGPGGGVGARMRSLVTAALHGDRAVVLDADALTSFAEASALGAVIAAGNTNAVILTPHQGEFVRVFHRDPAIRCSPSKLHAAKLAAERSHAVIVLKGADTIIAAPDGRAAISDNAPPWLATAGSGDVLTGIIAGLLAQNMPAFEAACAGVYIHGEAATAVGLGLISEDLPEVLPQIYRRLGTAPSGP
jgi:hydroxyethylthiazole kinase-like uncharacterized protein yjeF